MLVVRCVCPPLQKQEQMETLKTFQTEVGNFVPQMEEVETANQVRFAQTVRQTVRQTIHLQSFHFAGIAGCHDI